MGSVRPVISASRRTDIPRFFGEWFGNRRRAGFAEFRNAVGGHGRVEITGDDVFLFWTRFAKPFAEQLTNLRADGIPYVFQYTISGLGGTSIEPHAPPTAKAIADFLAVSADLPGPDCIQWRYDPIVLCEEFPKERHFTMFAEIAKRLEGSTRVVNVSFVEPYVKTIRRMAGTPAVQYRPFDPGRHKTTARKHPDLPAVSVEQVTEILGRLTACAASHGIELRLCANPELPAASRSRCCGLDMFEPYGGAVLECLAGLEGRPSRPGCQCLAVVDIGMDNTCVTGCKYCYVVVSQETAVRNIKSHDPTAPMLRHSAEPTGT
ncbi:MAG: DUF1848 family protein [Planctomycetota bacterium]|jgi:hypothetical protein